MANQVGIILIATGKYDKFIQPLLDSADKYFFSNKPIDVCLFADKAFTGTLPSRMSLAQAQIPHLHWPYPTLYRYKWITLHKYLLKADYVFYLDVDMLFVNRVNEEILPEKEGLVAVRHPGFYVNGKWGDTKTTLNSVAYVHPPLRGVYYAGGFQGGQVNLYLSACETMARGIEIDEKHRIIAGWHDESFWNHYLRTHQHKELSPAYCMVEQMELRQKWGIINIDPKIIALAKDHQNMRQ